MGKPTDGSYPLNTAKFVKISERLGNGENDMGAVTPIEHTVGGVTLTPETIRLGKKVRPYIIKDGTVLRPNGRTGVFVTLVQRAVEMAVALSHESPRMKFLSEGEIPLVFDANDFPWCGDDLVPIFRLNAIQSSAKCKHSWSQILFRSCKFTAQYVSKLLFQHYIPVKGDFSEIWTKQYEIRCRSKEHRANTTNYQECTTTLRTKLTVDQYTVDLLWTLLSYAELLANSPDFYDTWRRNKRVHIPCLNFR